MGGGDQSTNYPAPSQEEKDLQREQLELLREQRSDTEAFKPILLDQYGLEAAYGYKDPTGTQIQNYNNTEASLSQAIKDAQATGDVHKVIDAQKAWYDFVHEGLKGDKYITGYQKTAAQKEKDASYEGLLKSQNEITSLQLDRQKKALAGTLPISEGTTQRKQQEWTQFKEQMARQGNPIFGDSPDGALSTTTAGTQALKAFNDNWKLVEDQERRGEMTQGAQLLNNSIGLTSGLRTNETAVSAVPDLGTAKLLPQYVQAMQPYQMQRQGEFQASAANASNSAARFAGIMGLAGNAIGAGAGLYALSSKKYKKGVKPANDTKALSMLRKTKTFNYRYKGESDSAPERTGPVVETTAREIVSPDGEHIDVVKQVNMLHSALRALDKKVSRKAAA